MRRATSAPNSPRLLITMPWGIGDAVSIGLSAVDQVQSNNPGGEVLIDVLCNHLQATLFAHDPRIHALVHVSDALFPTAAPGSWKRGVFLPRRTLELARALRTRSYAAVMPFFFGPTFFYQLHAPVLFLNIGEAWQVVRALHNRCCCPLQGIVRQNINKFFAPHSPLSCVAERIPLYLCAEQVRKARQIVACFREQAGLADNTGAFLLVAPDTSSVTTRPPTWLLAQGIAQALGTRPDLFVQILPGYTDRFAAQRLWKELVPHFPGRVFQMADEPALSPPDLAALLDQCEIVITGDTSTMHLAAAYKLLANRGEREWLPRNQARIIALFGGTHPGLYGYSQRTLILGKWRKEQFTLTPGIAKDFYRPNGRDLFDHIAPWQLTEAILTG